MPRKSKVGYYATRGAYYTQHRGKQHLLARGPDDAPDGPTYIAAMKAYTILMEGRGGAGKNDATVRAVITRYFESLEQAGRKATLHLAKIVLLPAVSDFGDLKVRDLKPLVVRDWLAQQTEWNDNSKHTAIGKLLRALNWARKQGMIEANPISDIEKPERRARGKEVLIPEGMMDVLIASANREFAKLLLFLRHTGARPGEAVHARASHYRRSIGALVYPWQGDDVGWRWKNAKSRRDRVIYLTPELREMVEGEIAKRPDGYIFVGIRRRPLSSNGIVNLLFKLLEHRDVKAWCAANKFDSSHVMFYGFRHSFITKMLAAGTPIKLLADWCGTSVLMLERAYSHVHDDLEAMGVLFSQFSSLAAGGGAPPSSPPRP